jgi:hypothetical protein
MDQRFIVPQFIDTEDKILGPITVRQFIIMIVGGLLIFGAYKLADFALFAFETFFIAVFTFGFAFVKVNGAPFHLFFINFISTFKKPKIRVWKKEYVKVEEFKAKDEGKASTYVKRKRILPTSKLSELSLIIDTGGVYKGERAANQVNKVYNNS